MSDGIPEDEVFPCDVCEANNAVQWCDDCGQLLCAADECSAPHAGHAIGAIAAASAENGYDDAGDIHTDITEDAAYAMLGMMEANAHVSCRKLFLPHVQATRHTYAAASPWSSCAAAADEPFKLTDEQWGAFLNNSYLVIDNFVAPELALAARAETLALVEQGGVLTDFQNKMDVGRDMSARSDLRVFVTAAQPPANAGAMQGLVQRLQQLGDHLHEGVLLADKRSGGGDADGGAAAAPEYQLAYYGAAGQRYQRHRDGFPNDGTQSNMAGQVGRRVTATLYMNDYRDEHGGKLRVYPQLPDVSGDGAPVDVAPVAGRAVLFLSGAMDHEVLPSLAPRCAIAAWYS
jgi:SM-20-related protein